MPVPAGSYVRRVALTPHYDGVIRGHNEPAVIAICGIGPINFTLTDPSKPRGGKCERAAPSHRQMIGSEQLRQQIAKRESRAHAVRAGDMDYGRKSANSRMRWRQPPHGVHKASPSPTTRISAMRRSPASAIAAIAPASAQHPCG